MRMTPEEAANWTPTVRRRALAQKVLSVAVTRIEGAWAAYVDAVPGQKHSLEFEAVLDNGAKLDEAVARSIFPEFDGLTYAP